MAGPASAQDCPGPASLPRLDAAAFESLAGPALPPAAEGRAAAAVVVDLSPAGKARFLSACRYPHPADYLRAAGLSLDAGHALTENVRAEGRRLLVGWVLPGGDGWELLLWPDDEPTAEVLSEARRRLAGALDGPASLRPASRAQEEAGAAAGFALLPRASAPAGTQVLSPGVAVGRLRLAAEGEEATRFARGDVVLAPRAPAHLPDAAGLVVDEPATALSHLSLLARSFGLPAASVPGARRAWAHLAGKPVRLSVGAAEAVLEETSEEALARAEAERAARPRPVRLSADLEWSELTELSEQRAGDAARFGAKSANLGELAAARIEGVAVPRGFTVPFHWYARFLRANGLAERAAALAERPAGPEELSALRAAIRAGRHEPAFAALLNRRLAGYGGVYARSSTNAEDLPGFSGAGLYDTVPNAVGAAAALEAVKEVWASLWNERAYAARQRWGLDHASALPAVLLQEAVDAEVSGVALAPDPARPGELAVRLAAKRGLGARVVEGGPAPEELVYRAEGGRLERLRASADPAALRLAPGGGLRRAAAPAGPVLSDADARRLAAAVLAARRHFGGTPLDVEWALAGGRLYLLQARPILGD